MIKSAPDLTSPKWKGASKGLLAALTVMLGMAGMAETAHSAPAPAERLCTGGFNTAYGWFLNDTDLLGTQEVSGLQPSACVTATDAGLRVKLGSIELPLASAVTYTYGPGQPTLSMPLLEPALCEDYHSDDVGNLVLEVMDANGDEMFDGWSYIDSMTYTHNNGVLLPVRAAPNAGLFVCHSGLAANAPLPSAEPDDDDVLFADGFELTVGADLQLLFLDEQDNVIDGDYILDQAVSGSVTFKVKVTNIGPDVAHDVRIREFVPTSSNLLMPTVTRGPCIDHGANGTDQLDCTNGDDAHHLNEHLGDLLPGASRVYTLNRTSTGTNTGESQSMALIQVAAFANPVTSPDIDSADNSRSLRIRMVDKTRVTRAVSTNGTSSTAGGTITVQSTPSSGNCTTSGSVTSCDAGTSGVEFLATANSGYTLAGFSGCSGTSDVNNTSGTFTTGSGSSCTVTANFHSMPTVTATVSGSHGSISPATQQVHYNDKAVLTVNPDVGYAVDTIQGCGGVTLDSGNTWKTANVTENCAVEVSFAVAQYTVSATAIGHGTVTPASVSVQHGQPVSFTVLPDSSEYEVVNVTSDCANFPGGWFNNEYLLSGVVGSCSIQFEFGLITHTVTADDGITGGAIIFLDENDTELPGNTVQITHGQAARFKLVPDEGYSFTPGPGAVSATGCTLGTVGYDFPLASYVGSTGTITTDNCVVTANFTFDGPP